MTRLSRFLFGGVIGAGLALILSPKSGKEIRSLLMGSGRKQLPAAEEDYRAPSDYAVPAATTPASRQGVSLESRIKATRQQVEQEIDKTFVPASHTVPDIPEEALAETPPVIEEAAAAFVAETAPVIEEAAAAFVAETAPAAVEAETPMVVEPDMPAAPEAPAFEAEQTSPSPAKEIPKETVPGEDLTRAHQQAAAKEWETLKTPAAGEPTLEADLNAIKKPPAETAPAPSGIDRDEMRKRIDETRARLKAKAFDAMISGETFVEGETGHPAPEKKETAGPGMDQETADQIDETLREED
ncbi:MAG: YtxH domain-containing protein [Chloroflexi bacterium]|nr:YtxH domain-containing protein [Chloroflexota bacterium]